MADQERDPMRGHNGPPVFTKKELQKIALAITFVTGAGDLIINGEHREILGDFVKKVFGGRYQWRDDVEPPY